MATLWSHFALAGLWGGLLALERNAFLQAMFSRPLVAATGAGLLLMDMHSGLFVGLFFELFHLGGASLGGARQDHEMLPAVTATAAAAAMANASGAASTPALWTLGILLFAPMGPLGAALERALDRRAARYQSRAMLSAQSGQLRSAARQNLRAMWPHFVFFGLLCAAAWVVGFALAPVEERLPLALTRGLAWAYPAMASVAAAVAVRGSRARNAPQIAVGAAALVTVGAALVALWGPR